MDKKYLKVIIPIYDGWIFDEIVIGESFCYDNREEIIKAYPDLCNNENLVLNIRLSDGFITNWPVGKEGSFCTVKLVDSGSYYITDEGGNNIETYEEAYVPEVLSIVERGFGDYLEFDVTKEGYIKGWKYDTSKKLYKQSQEEY